MMLWGTLLCLRDIIGMKIEPGTHKLIGRATNTFVEDLEHEATILVFIV